MIGIVVWTCRGTDVSYHDFSEVYFALARKLPVMATPQEVAQWMVAQLDERQRLLQVEAAHAIKNVFGPEFYHLDPDGEFAIDRRVLYHFRKLTGETVVWVTKQGGGFCPEAHWRRRQRGDSVGRTQYVWWEMKDELCAEETAGDDPD